MTHSTQMSSAARPGVSSVIDTTRPGRIRLDPRTVIVLVIAVSASVMGPGGLTFVPTGMVVAVGLAACESARRRIVILIAVVVSMWFCGWVLPALWTNPLTALISLTSTYGIRLVPALGVGAHLIATTSPTQLSAALRSWRMPRPLAVTLAVIVRFFPVVAAEAAAVLDAMRLRGLTGVRGLARHPVLAIERFVVPMIAASLRASEDLSASAILRGLGSRQTPTVMTPPRFGAADALTALGVVALAAAAFLLPNPLT